MVAKCSLHIERIQGIEGPLRVSTLAEPSPRARSPYKYMSALSIEDLQLNKEEIARESKKEKKHKHKKDKKHKRHKERHRSTLSREVCLRGSDLP